MASSPTGDAFLWTKREPRGFGERKYAADSPTRTSSPRLLRESEGTTRTLQIKPFFFCPNKARVPRFLPLYECFIFEEKNEQVELFFFTFKVGGLALN